MNTIVSAASVASAAAVASPSIGSELPASDHPAHSPFEALWVQYLDSVKTLMAAGEAHAPHSERRDEQMDALPEDCSFDERLELGRRLAADPDFRGTQGAINAAYARQTPIVAAIHAAPATTIFEIGVKLAAMPTLHWYADECDAEDFKDGAIAVLRDIDALLGTDFAGRYEPMYTTCLLGGSAEDDEEDQDGDDAES